MCVCVCGGGGGKRSNSDHKDEESKHKAKTSQTFRLWKREIYKFPNLLRDGEQNQSYAFKIWSQWPWQNRLIVFPVTFYYYFFGSLKS